MKELTSLQIARIAHESIRALQAERMDPYPNPPWDWDEEHTRVGYIHAVELIQSGHSDEEVHEHWCEIYREDGWTYGPEKDPELRTHPFLMKYSEVSDVHKLSDILFRFIVTALTI